MVTRGEPESVLINSLAPLFRMPFDSSHSLHNAKSPFVHARWPSPNSAHADPVVGALRPFRQQVRNRGARQARFGERTSRYVFAHGFFLVCPLVRFSKRNRPLLPPTAKSRSPSPSISATGICMPPPTRPP